MSQKWEEEDEFFHLFMIMLKKARVLLANSSDTWDSTQFKALLFFGPVKHSRMLMLIKYD